MSIAKVQSVTGNGSTLILNGVVAGSALIYASAYFRSAGSALKEAAPTDSNGTFLAASNDVPNDIGHQTSGASIFYEENAAAGTHTVTPEANTIHNCSLTEFSGMAVSGLFDVATSAVSVAGNQTSQDTGAIVTAQADELEFIALTVWQNFGGNPIGITDPVPSTTTIKIGQNTNTDIGNLHAFEVLSVGGRKSETFNWMTTDALTASFGCIAAFNAAPRLGESIDSSNLTSFPGRYIGWTA